MQHKLWFSLAQKGRINMKVILIIVLLILNIPVYKYLFNLFFHDLYDFTECLRYLGTWDYISLAKGEYLKDQLHEAKVIFYFFCCAVIVVIEYFLISIILNKIL